MRHGYKDWWFWIICAAIAGLFMFSAYSGHPQTNEPAPALTPQSVAQSFTAWNAVALLIGATIWHFILKIAPWAKANGGLLKGVIRFFWDFDIPLMPPKPPT